MCEYLAEAKVFWSYVISTKSIFFLFLLHVCASPPHKAGVQRAAKEITPRDENEEIKTAAADAAAGKVESHTLHLIRSTSPAAVPLMAVH